MQDVSLDASSAADGRTARTNTRLIADHLGLAPGTVARALARLTAAGLVERQDRRHSLTGRFVESVYCVSSLRGIVPCVDCPHTAEPLTAVWPAPAASRTDDPAGQRLPEGMTLLSVVKVLGSGGAGKPNDGPRQAGRLL